MLKASWQGMWAAGSGEKRKDWDPPNILVAVPRDARAQLPHVAATSNAAGSPAQLRGPLKTAKRQRPPVSTPAAINWGAAGSSVSRTQATCCTALAGYYVPAKLTQATNSCLLPLVHHWLEILGGG